MKFSQKENYQILSNAPLNVRTTIYENGFNSKFMPTLVLSTLYFNFRKTNYFSFRNSLICYTMGKIKMQDLDHSYKLAHSCQRGQIQNENETGLRGDNCTLLAHRP